MSADLAAPHDSKLHQEHKNVLPTRLALNPGMPCYTKVRVESVTLRKKDATEQEHEEDLQLTCLSGAKHQLQMVRPYNKLKPALCWKVAAKDAAEVEMERLGGLTLLGTARSTVMGKLPGVDVYSIKLEYTYKRA